MMRKEEKTKVIEENKLHDGDTGSPEVQIAILTKRINDLTEHLKNNKIASGVSCLRFCCFVTFGSIATMNNFLRN